MSYVARSMWVFSFVFLCQSFLGGDVQASSKAYDKVISGNGVSELWKELAQGRDISVRSDFYLESTSRTAVFIVAAGESRRRAALTPLNLYFRDMIQRVSENYSVDVQHASNWDEAARILYDHDPYDLLIILGHGNSEGITLSAEGVLDLESDINPQTFRRLNPEGRILCCACEAGGSGRSCDEFTIAHHVAEASHVRVRAPRQEVTATDGERFLFRDTEVASHLSLSGRFDHGNFRHAERLLSLFNEGEHEELIRSIKEIGNLDLPLNIDGSRLFHLAVSVGEDDLFEWLMDHRLKYRGDINVQNHAGDTALHMAALLGNVRVVDLLMRVPEIDLLRTNNIGDTAFTIVQRMIDVFENGRSPEALSDYRRIAELLVTRGRATYQAGYRRLERTAPVRENVTESDSGSDMSLISEGESSSEEDDLSHKSVASSEEGSVVSVTGSCMSRASF